MAVPNDRKYTETHEWFMIDGDTVTMGITQYAAEELTDITYVELPDPGTSLGVGDAIGEVESVKATSELFSSVAGEVIEINTALADQPELVNSDAFEEGWMVRIRPESTAPLAALMTGKDYDVFLENGI